MELKNCISTVFFGLMALALLNCSGADDNDDSNDDDAIPEPEINILPNPDINATSSYENQKTDIFISREEIGANGGFEEYSFIHGIAYADFDLDGDTDVFISGGGILEETTTYESQFFTNNGNSEFFPANDALVSGAAPFFIHSRKAITGDYNGDGIPDIFVVGHGWNQPPFIGELPYLMLSAGGKFIKRNSNFGNTIGYHHAAASADIDNDGDEDILVTSLDLPFFLINNGFGEFMPSIDQLPTALLNADFLTTELIDVDGDGYIDILAGGVEWSTMQTSIFWGNSTGVYFSSIRTTLQDVADMGTVIDMDADDLNGDGLRDIVVNRVRDDGSFENGSYVQLLFQTSKRSFRSANLPNNRSSAFIDWIRIQDIDNDGDLDIMADDKSLGLIWKNDGTGNFSF